jgi:cyclic beta-1,2-glucan synthetase
VRENGGQYTHAALWVVMAMAGGQRRRGGRAVPHAQPRQPHADAADVERYKAEPYVVAGDVYAHPAHAGRGGWSWYTGSAGWMYRAGLESILGLTRRGATFEIDPASRRPGRLRDRLALRPTRYEIAVSNPARRCRGIA